MKNVSIPIYIHEQSMTLPNIDFADTTQIPSNADLAADADADGDASFC